MTRQPGASQTPAVAAAKVPRWIDLFEPFYMDHVCEALRVQIEDLRVLGAPTLINLVMREKLLEPLGEYMETVCLPPGHGISVEHQAAQALADEVESIAELIEDRRPFEDGDAEMHKRSLRARWVEFIAQGAAHRIYWDLPREAEEKTRQTEQRRTAAKQVRKAKSLTPQALAEFVLANPQLNRKGKIAALCALYPDASVRTIELRWSTAISLGLLRSAK